ncbi:MAG TPA: hypothetical protein VIL66_10520 [Bacillota bacterium]
MLALLIIFIPKEPRKDKKTKMPVFLASLCLLGYYGTWLVYYAGIVFSWLFVGMAFLPAVYFIAVELWLDNYILCSQVLFLG